jgi:predicted glycosyltransferase involved in capsule biosynthesis
MKINYIIGHKGEGTRLKNLVYVLQHTQRFNNINIILIEQDESPKIPTSIIPKNIKHIFIKNPGLYNRSWGFNVGYKNTENGYLFFADNDILLKENNFKLAERLLKDFDAIKPYSAIIDTKREEANRIIAKNGLIDIKRHARDGVNFCGGMVIFKRELFEKMGGWDEDFRGWGGEDDAMAFKMRMFTKNIKTIKGVAYHLWHERGEGDNRKQAHYNQNINKLHWYSKTDKAKIKESLDINKIGNPEKYE